MSERQLPQQRPPRVDADLSMFPEAIPSARDVKFRAHSAQFGGAAGAWHFSSRPTARFNLEPPRGTCYVADRPQTALHELLGPELQDMQGIGVELASTLMVTPVSVPDDTRTADLDHENAVAFGVINELSASAYETYDVPRRRAAAFEAAGFGGIRYISRLVSGSTSASWAIFGPSGPAPEMPFSEADARRATEILRAMGVALFGEELAADLTVEDPPEWTRPSGRT